MGSFEVVRKTTIDGPPERIHALLDDFHQWSKWSPWEDVDPNLQRTYTGPDSGVGARYAWKGNRKAGEGNMEITASSPDRIEVRLAFLKPMAATNRVEFLVTPAGSGTEVTWRMTGEQTGVWGVVGKVFPMDRMVGRDFVKGLTRLKAVVENAS